MKSLRLGVGVMIAVQLSVGAQSCIALDEHADQTYDGIVYDLDYLGVQGWTQVLFRANGGAPSLVAATRSSMVQGLLEAALLDKLGAHVTYEAGNPGEPAMLLTASVVAPSSCSGKGCVQSVRCTAAGDCSTQINGEVEDVKTSDARALGILLTAIRKQKNIEYLAVTNEHVIQRVKINVE